jgi:formiminotetrahydrofolate cyclodeaminase
LELALEGFLELVSAAEPTPAGGSAAAMTVALAAGLCAMAARLSTRQLPDAPGIVVAAEQLRDRAATLCQADAEAFGRLVSATRELREPDPDGRRRRITEALLQATEVPLAIVETGAGVASLAARIAERGNPNLLGDAVAAALLAEAGARAAATLVLVNLKGLPDERASRVKRLIEEIAESARRAGRHVES